MFGFVNVVGGDDQPAG